MMSSHGNPQMYQSKSKIQYKPPIFIKIKDKKIISNFLLMTKKIVKESIVIYLRIVDSKLYIYSNEENEDKIRYLIHLDPISYIMEVRNLDTLSICLDEYFAELLELFLLNEEFLQLEIDHQNEHLKLFSETSNFVMGFNHVQKRFQIFKSPEENYDFKIDFHKLEELKELGGGDKNSRRIFYFNKEKFKFVSEESKNHGFNVYNNEQYGIVVNRNSFNELIQKFRVISNKNQAISNDNCCVCFYIGQNFLNYFSVAPHIVKASKKSKKEKVGEINNTVNNFNNQSSHLSFGEKIYFKIKEIQLNPDNQNNNENNFVNQASIRMSAARKHNGKNIEEFYFDSANTIDVIMSRDVFRVMDDEFAKLKEKGNSCKNLNGNVSSFYIFGTSQNPLYISNIENNHNMNIINNRNNNNNNSLLLNAKIEVDDDYIDGNFNNQNLPNDNNNIDNTLSIHTDNNNSLSDAMKILSRKKSMEIRIEEVSEDSSHDLIKNKNLNNMILNTNLNTFHADSNILNSNLNVINTNPNNQSSRGGCNINNINNPFTNNPANTFDKINHNANMNKNTINNANILVNNNKNPTNIKLDPIQNNLPNRHNIQYNNLNNLNQANPNKRDDHNQNKLVKINNHYVGNVIPENLDISTFSNNKGNNIFTPFVANLSSVNKLVSLNEFNFNSTNQAIVNPFLSINKNNNQNDQINLEERNVNAFRANEPKNHNADNFNKNFASKQIVHAKINDQINPFLSNNTNAANKIPNLNINTNIKLDVDANLQKNISNNKNIPKIPKIPKFEDFSKYIKKED